LDTARERRAVFVEGSGGGPGWMYWFWCQGARRAGRMASQIMEREGGVLGSAAG
jgi:hypothetical protein